MFFGLKKCHAISEGVWCWLYDLSPSEKILSHVHIKKYIYMSLSSLVFMHLTSPMAVLDRYQLISVIVSRPSASERESQFG